MVDCFVEPGCLNCWKNGLRDRHAVKVNLIP